MITGNDLQIKKKLAIIVDIDNTFCESEFIFDEIEKLGLTGEIKWDYFHKNIDRCKVNDWCVMLVNNYLSLGYEVVFLTARSEEIQKETWDFIAPFLKNYRYKYNISLYMRKKNDKAPAWVVKKKWLEQIKHFFSFSFALDDDIENCIMYKSFDIPVLYPIRSINKTKISSKEKDKLSIH